MGGGVARHTGVTCNGYSKDTEQEPAVATFARGTAARDSGGYRRQEGKEWVGTESDPPGLAVVVFLEGFDAEGF